MPELLLLPQPQIHNHRSNSLPQRESMPPLQHRVESVDGAKTSTDFRSRRVELQLNLVVGTQSASVASSSAAAAAAIVSGSAAALRGAVRVALEGVGPASHRTGEPRAVDSLGDAIAGAVLVLVVVVVVVMVAHILHIAITTAGSWPETESPLTNQIKLRFRFVII